jgi:drug/metabolite transporter (DMT)-like permease
LVFVAIVLIAWGVLGIFQKLSTNHISAESTIIWLVVGFLLFQPFVYPDRPLSSYSTRNIWFGLLSGLLSNIGAWGLFEAMKSGGKVSIVSPFCALYPLPVVLLAPFVFHERITLLQTIGVACALLAVVLLSQEAQPEASGKDELAASVRAEQPRSSLSA